MSTVQEPTKADAADPTASPTQKPIRSASWQVLAEKWALLGLFVVMMVFFLTAADGFSNSANLRIVVGTQAPLVILALASMIPLVVGQFDLSVAATAGISGIALVAITTEHQLPLMAGLVGAILFGMLIGLVNGILVAYVEVNAFIVTLGMGTVLQGVAAGYTGGAVMPGLDVKPLLTALSGNVGGIPKGVLWFLPATLIVWYVIEQTPYGRHLRAIGSNAGAAKLLGLPTKRLTLSTFLVAGAMGGLAGVVLVGQTGSADPSVTLGTLLLPAIAAAFLGASAFQPGLFNAWGTLLAIFVVAFLINGLQFLGAEPWTSPVINGVVLIGAVTVSSLLRRERARR